MKTRLTSHFPACLLRFSYENQDINCETEHLVRRVEVAHDQVNIVFRIDPYPGDPDPEKKSWQLCRGSALTKPGQCVPTLRAGSLVGKSGQTALEMGSVPDPIRG